MNSLRVRFCDKEPPNLGCDFSQASGAADPGRRPCLSAGPPSHGVCMFWLKANALTGALFVALR